MYPTLIKAFIPTSPNQLWVSDITYIPILISDSNSVFCYLSLIMDAYSQEIMGYQIGDTLVAFYCIMALRKALQESDKRKTDLSNLIHHSDRGTQHASSKYTNMLKKRKIAISMTESGNPKENPQAERINSTFKNELFYGLQFKSISEVRASIKIAVEFYNTNRPDMSIDMMTPLEAFLCQGELNKRWHSYREAAINKLSNGKLIPE